MMLREKHNRDNFLCVDSVDTFAEGIVVEALLAAVALLSVEAGLAEAGAVAPTRQSHGSVRVAATGCRGHTEGHSLQGAAVLTRFEASEDLRANFSLV